MRNAPLRHKRYLLSLIIGVALLAVITIGQAFVGGIQNWLSPESVQGRQLDLGRTSYSLEEAKDAESQQLGLSGRSGLDRNSGMLFVFDSDQGQCIWMKDMKFNIDIVWLNQNKRITQIKPDVSPATYPETFCADAKYVLELPSGTASKHHLTDGQILKF